ncbi:MAG: type I-B CRISPR-associated endonuclease Cas1b [Thermacetogeniaceae bacterium]
MNRTYYLFSSGCLRRKDNTLAFETADSRRYLPVEDIDHIYCFGELDLNSKLLDFLGQHGISIHFFDYYGNYTGTFLPRESLNSGVLLVRQVEHYLDAEKRLVLARCFVEGAIHNIRRNLEKRCEDEACQRLDEFREAAKEAGEIGELMSVEAHVRKLYYSKWEEITGWEFGERSKRPPANALNALISFGNSMLYTTVLKEIRRTALSPVISYLHEPSERRYSLALDVSEIFKPILVDRLIFRLINQGTLNEGHFDQNLNCCYLKESGRKIFVQEFEQLLENTIIHRKLRRKVKYKSLIRLDLYKLIKHLLGEDSFSPMKVWW